jgi:hypothetical protein
MDAEREGSRGAGHFHSFEESQVLHLHFVDLETLFHGNVCLSLRDRWFSSLGEDNSTPEGSISK